LPLPHLAGQEQLAQALSAAAVYDFHRADAASAAANIHTMLALVNGWKDEPLLISQPVRIAMAAIGNPQTGMSALQALAH
jgi:hypothetical protein